MSTPIIVQKAPFQQKLKRVDRIFGAPVEKVGNSLLCDGSHKGTDFTPLKYTAEKTGKVFFCGCKQVKTGRFAMGATQSFNPLEAACETLMIRVIKNHEKNLMRLARK